MNDLDEANLRERAQIAESSLRVALKELAMIRGEEK